MGSFKQFVTEGRSRGEDMEDVIIAAWNKQTEPKGVDIPSGAGKNIAAFLRKQGVKGKASSLGASTIDVSKEWAKFWPGTVPSSTRTPKTDIMIGTNRVSLKTGDSAQLMSGGRNESLATFYTAAKASKLNKKVTDKIGAILKDLAGSSVAKSNLKDEIKSGKDKVVVAADKAHKTIMGILKKEFSSNEAFANAFASEAMSGYVKFGNSAGTAQYFLTASWDGKKAGWHDVSDKSYVSNIASKMKTSVRFKTTSIKTKAGKTGEYRYWSVVGLIADKLNESFAPYEDGKLELTEGILGDIANKVKGWFSKIWSGVMSYINKGIKFLLKFLGLSPEVSYNNNIDMTDGMVNIDLANDKEEKKDEKISSGSEKTSPRKELKVKMFQNFVSKVASELKDYNHAINTFNKLLKNQGKLELAGTPISRDLENKIDAFIKSKK